MLSLTFFWNFWKGKMNSDYRNFSKPLCFVWKTSVVGFGCFWN
jgi:hypothetical protein